VLREKLKNLKNELYITIESLGLSDEQTIKKSQELDLIILEVMKHESQYN